METIKKKDMAPTRYDEIFKEVAIRMVTEQGHLISKVAQNSVSAQIRSGLG